jgi:hypothetical protein
VASSTPGTRPTVFSAIAVIVGAPVPVLDREAEQQHHGERGAAPAQTAALLLDDDVDRLLLPHVDDRTASSLMLRAM